MTYVPVAQRKTTVSTGGYTPVAQRQTATYKPVASRVSTELPKKQLGTGAVIPQSFGSKVNKVKETVSDIGKKAKEILLPNRGFTDEQLKTAQPSFKTQVKAVPKIISEFALGVGSIGDVLIDITGTRGKTPRFEEGIVGKKLKEFATPKNVEEAKAMKIADVVSWIPVGSIKVSKSVSELMAKSKDAKYISNLLKKEVPNISDDGAETISKILTEVDNADDVQTVINRTNLAIQKGKQVKELPPLPKLGSAEKYQETGPLTTKILKDLEGKTTVSKQYILDATNRGELKQTERDLIRRILDEGSDNNPLLQEARKYKSAEEFVKAQGTPVYHGTNNKFDNFDPKRIGSRDSGWFGKGFYFTQSKGEAEYYGKNIIEATLDLKKPFDFSKFGNKDFNGYGFSDGKKLSDLADVIPEIRNKLKVSIADEIPTDKNDYKRSVREITFGEYDARVKKEKLSKQSEYYLDDKNGVQYYSYKDIFGNEKDFRFTNGKIKIPDDILDYVLFNEKYKVDTNTNYLYGVEKEIADKIGDNFTKRLKDLGYDGTIQSPDGDEYVAFYPEQIKTKSQLTDIYNQAVKSDTINVADFAKKVKAELLPLNVKSSDKVNVKAKDHYASNYMIDEGDFSSKYENIALSKELRGKVANYRENIYESPIVTSAGDVHFKYNTKNYFGHTRIEDMADDQTRRVIEVQSDLYQKGNLEKELYNHKDYLTLEQNIKSLQDNIKNIKNGDVFPGISKSERNSVIKSEQSKIDDLKEKISIRESKSKLQQYNDPTAHFRMIREEIKKAAQDGKTKLQFPTGETAMKIEGLGDSTLWALADNTNTRLMPDTLEVGREIVESRAGQTGENLGDSWIITDVLGDGKFKAVPKSSADELEEAIRLGFDKKVIETLEYTKNRNIETFDISGKVDTNNPIYKFYEKEVTKYLNKFGGKRVVDEKGVSWIEVPVTKEQGKAPVEAFQMGDSSKFDLTIPEAKATLRKMFDEDEMSFMFPKELIKGNAVGSYSNEFSNIISLVQKNGKVRSATAYHESFHGYFNTFIPEKQRVELINKVNKDFLTKRERKALKDRYDGDDVIAEEWLANDFAKYVSDISNKKKPSSIFARIWQGVLYKIRTLIRKKNEFDKLYQDILNKKRTGFKEKTYDGGMKFDKSEDDYLRSLEEDALKDSPFNNPKNRFLVDREGRVRELGDLKSPKLIRIMEDSMARAGIDDPTEFSEGLEKYFKQKSDLIKRKNQTKRTSGEASERMNMPRSKTPMDEKMIIQRRRAFVSDLRDRFGLDDSDLRKLTRRDIRLMNNYEFKQFIDDLEQRAIQLSDTVQAKAELMDLIEQREFKKVENYRKALELPAVKDMTASQLRQYAEALEGFNVGDEFLTTRTIETIDRTDMTGVRTIREIKERLLKQVEEATGKKLTIDELEEYAKVPAFARMTYDTALAEKNPFWKYTVQRIQEKMISGQARSLIVRDEVNRLAKLADASRKRGLIGSVKQFVIPKHEEIIRYLEAPVDQKLNYAKFMTKEELDYANYVSQYYSDAYEHLVSLKELQGSRFVDQYFTHTRKTFLEKWSDDGIIEAFKNMWQAQKDDAIVAKIIDQDTGKILPKAKFFQYTLQRTGDLDPSQNLTRVFNQYVSMFERKKMFDNMIPEMDAYTQALTPKNLTPKGLEMDRSLKTFMNEYLNNKKGRRSNFGGVLPQNGALDIGLRMSNTLVSLRDLGFNIGANVASLVGEQMTTYQALGKAKYAVAWKRRLWDTGIKRLGDKNANKILKEAEAFIGRNIWTEMAEANQQFGDRALQAIFGIFSQSTAEANKIFLLGNLTKEEIKAGKISTLKMAELRLEAGRWRDMGKDVKSIVGSTSFGQSATKYKGWAIPILRTNIKNITELASKLKNKQFDEALTSRELQETYRAVEATLVLLVVGNYVISQDDDESFAGKMKARVYQEAMTLLGGIDPTLFLMAPRNASFMLELAENLKMIAKWEEYEKTSRWGEKGDLKGFNGLLRQLTPGAVKQFQGEKNAEKKTSIGLPKLPKINAGLPKLPKISI